MSPTVFGFKVRKEVQMLQKMSLICPVRGKAKISSPAKKEAEEGKSPSDKRAGATETTQAERSVSVKFPLKGELHLSLIHFHTSILLSVYVCVLYLLLSEDECRNST